MHATLIRNRFFVGLFVVGAGLMATAGPAVAKGPLPAVDRRVRIAADVAFQRGGSGDILIQADRQTVRRLRRAEQFIKDKQYLDAVDLLQRVLDREKDAFYYPNPEKREVLQSVRQAAERLIAGMPKDGQDAYQLKFGAAAKVLLDDAVKAARIAAVRDVARRHFHTPAGREAMYRLGAFYWDFGQPMAAGLCFERLRSQKSAAEWEPMLSLRAAACWSRAGLPKKTETALKSFLKHNRGADVRLGGRAVRPFAKTEDGPAWLAKNFPVGRAFVGVDEWVVFRGNRRRNAISSLPEKPAGIRWRLSTIVDPFEPSADVDEKVETDNIKLLKSIVKTLENTNQRRKVPLPLRSHPLVVDGTVLVRTLDSLRGIELKDGTLSGEAIQDEDLYNALTTNGKVAPGSPVHGATTIVRQRLYGDLTWGTLSSNGRHVFAIHEMGVGYPTYDPKTRRRYNPRAYNRLMAYDVRGGRNRWAMGGPETDKFIDDAAPATFFLGAPLPLGEILYCLAEVSGEIRLLAFDQRSPGPGKAPELIWSQPLVASSISIDRDWARRQGGASLSYADGVMVCNTDAGFVIGVDLTSRSLLWAYRYEHARVRPFPGPFPRPRPPTARTEWFDHAALIADGKVVITPRGSAELYCLNLVDGSVAWKKPQADGLYVAGVVEDKVLLIGSGTMQALNLGDGKTAWKKSIGNAAVPSGRGAIAGNHLFVPTLADGVVAYDVKNGKLLGKQKLPGERRPGNLVISGGAMISQGIDGIDAFPLPIFRKP